MSIEITPKIEERLRNEKTVWLTTVRADGMPQPTPVWFLWENGTFLIYSNPKARKLRNIAQNPKVALSFNMDEWGDELLVVTGEAKVDASHPLSKDVPAYIEKYREGIKGIEMTPESLATEFSAAIVVTPTKVRDE
jgi:PPOX class probable F420-dependent enzyme